MQFLFIVTYGRTGSTAVQMALNTLPGYCIRGENGGVMDHLAQSARVLRDARENQESKSTTVRDPWFGLETAQPDRLEKALAETFTQTVLVPPEHATTVGFKEVRYLRQSDEEFFAILDFMQRMFEPRFIFLTRDPVAVSKSGWWAKQPKALEKLTATCDRIRAAHERYPSFLIDHADFNDNPSGIVPLIDWLGEDPAPAVEALSTRLTHMQKTGSKGLREKVSARLGTLLR